jgi:putative FmdB family regulatory protein
MPLYEYRCQECGRTFEKLRRMSDADAGTECPYCESDEVRRQMSTFATGGCGAPAGGGSRFR